MFPLLRELDIVAVRQPQLDMGLYENRWALEFMHASSLTHLRRLRITRPFSPDMLPQIFFLPNLRTLELSAFDARNIDTWSLPQGFVPRRSTVTHFSLFAILTSSQLLQIISWPATLESFTYRHEGYRISDAQPPMPRTFHVALQPFRHTLKNLKVQMSDWYLTNDGSVEEEFKFRPPLLDPRRFSSLQELQVPSFFLFGFPGKQYNRSTLPNLLPSSLSFLEIVFGPENVLDDVPYRLGVPEFHDMGEYIWLSTLSEQCTEWGRLPALRKFVLRQEAHRTPELSTRRIHQDFRLQNLQIELRGFFSEEEDWGFSDEYWSYSERYEYGIDEVFGEEDTVYSDSPRGSAVDEDFIDEELLEDEYWESFDNKLAKEKAVDGEKWIRGQWPPYEETREVRDDIFMFSNERQI